MIGVIHDLRQGAADGVIPALRRDGSFSGMRQVKMAGRATQAWASSQ
jgi:hypothetical protein